MKKLFTIALINLLCMAGMAQVTYCGSNNFFMNYFTDTGFSSYDWRFEPLKTDLQRGGLKGQVVKVVTNLTERMNSSSVNIFTDTTYYNAQGNISKIVAIKRDIGDWGIVFNPDVWQYEYDSSGILSGYVYWTETVAYDFTERKDYVYLQKNVHTMEKDALGRITKEYCTTYSQEKDGNWRESVRDELEWTFVYDENGELSSGKGAFDLLLTYKNGQLVKMYEENFKPVTYTYDSEGHLVEFNYFWVDGWDDEDFYTEYYTELSYNEYGDIDGAVCTRWDCDAQWQRRQVVNTKVYTFAYTYDSHGNWTEVVVNEEDTYDPQQVACTITREITYDDDDGTGIQQMKSDKVSSDNWYNLSGLRVDSPKEGIYIHNGRKVVSR